MSCNTCDIQIPKSLSLEGCKEPSIGHFSLTCFLKKWLSRVLTAVNGLTFEPSTLTFKLGGELTEVTEINTNSYDFKLDNNESYFLATSAHPLSSSPFIGFIHDSVNDDKLYINGILALGTESHNYSGVLDTTTYEETCIEVSYFEDFLAIPNTRVNPGVEKINE